jgi:hypothetical protein
MSQYINKYLVSTVKPAIKWREEEEEKGGEDDNKLR